jgi:hypothetical protein
MHHDTNVEGCQDACRRGHRCEGRLDELEVLKKSVMRPCTWCLYEHRGVADMVSGLREWNKTKGRFDGTDGV